MSTPNATRQGSLVDRGGGLLYDEVLDITWLQDASWAQTSGYKANGKMNWKDANAWAGQLVFRDEARGVDLRGWRLPRVLPRNGKTWDGRFCLDGSSDEGYNFCTPHSELAWMFYMNLGLKGYYSQAGEEEPMSGAGGNGKMGYVVNVGLVKNLKSYVYWTSTPAEPYPDRNGWMFDFIFGFQNFYNQNDMLCPWAVRDGDVAEIVARKGEARRAEKPYAHIKPPKIPIEIVEEPRHHELDTYTETLAGARCELPFDDSIKADRYAVMKSGMETVLSTPDLEAFWVFGEKPGQARQSIIAGAPFPMKETHGPVPRRAGGSYSAFSAELTGGLSLEWTAAKPAAGGLLAQASSITLFAVIRPEAGSTLVTLQWEESSNPGTARSVPLDVAGLDLPRGKWATVGMTLDGTQATWFLNGNAVKRKIEPALPSGGPFKLTVGSTRADGWQGLLAGFAAYRRTLNADEMIALHGSAKLETLD